jgi:kynurenine formamidase
MINLFKNVLPISLMVIVMSNADAADSNSSNQINYKNIVDLSHVIDTNIPLWPGDPLVEFDTVASIPTDGYFLRKFSIGEHSATHINAPNSFFENGASIDTYTPKSLVVKAVVIDIRPKTKFNPDYSLTVADVLAWEQVHGKIKSGSVVLLYTGWQEKWKNPTAFINQDADGVLHFPGFSAEATNFMLAQRSIKGVGIDTHGADPGIDPNYSTNTAVLSQKGIVLECLTNLDKLAPVGNTLVLGALKLKGGSGTPLSVMAFVP